MVQTQTQRIWVSNVRQTTSNQGIANGKIPREPQSKDNTHSLPAPMSTWTYLYQLVQPRRTRKQAVERTLVDEYKGKDTK